MILVIAAGAPSKYPAGALRGSNASPSRSSSGVTGGVTCGDATAGGVVTPGDAGAGGLEGGGDGRGGC